MTIRKQLFYSMACGERSREALRSNEIRFRIGLPFIAAAFPLVSPLHLARCFKRLALAARGCLLLQPFWCAQLQFDVSFELDRVPDHPRPSLCNILSAGGNRRTLFVVISPPSGSQPPVP